MTYVFRSPQNVIDYLYEQGTTARNRADKCKSIRDKEKLIAEAFGFEQSAYILSDLLITFQKNDGSMIDASNGVMFKNMTWAT